MASESRLGVERVRPFSNVGKGKQALVAKDKVSGLSFAGSKKGNDDK